MPSPEEWERPAWTVLIGNTDGEVLVNIRLTRAAASAMYRDSTNCAVVMYRPDGKECSRRDTFRGEPLDANEAAGRRLAWHGLRETETARGLG